MWRRFLLLVFVCGFVAAQRQTVTSTFTTISTTTVTVLSSTSTLCASYVSASTSCRRKRDFWLLPKLLAGEEHVDPVERQFIVPSAVEPVQATARPHVQPYYRQGLDDYYVDDSPGYLQPSRFNLIPQMVHYNRYPHLGWYRAPEPLFFSQVAAFATFLGNVFNLPSTTTVLATSLTTFTSTLYTTTRTVTLTISSCFPAGITFKNC